MFINELKSTLRYICYDWYISLFSKVLASDDMVSEVCFKIKLLILEYGNNGNDVWIIRITITTTTIKVQKKQ